MSDTPKRRAPAFQLYADDFLSGTSEMTAEEVGAYIRLLCHQWTKGGLPNDPERLVRMAGLMGSPMGSPSSGYVVAKFSLCADGMLRNARLERIREERESFIQKQSESGKSGALKRWNPGNPNGEPNRVAMATPMATPMANGCPNDSSPSPSPSPIKKDIAPSSPWAVAFGLELPEKLQTQNCLEAAKLWLEYKKENRKGYKRIGLQSTLTKWANEFTAATFPSAVENSIASNWSGVFPNREQSAPLRQPVQSQPEGDYSKMNKEQRKNYEDWLLKQAL
jgi:uncharacterized protein YdaU (DUF1376 family)